MEGIRGADALAQFDSFLVGLLLLGRRLGVGAAHLRDGFLIRGRGGRAVGLVGHFGEQAALEDAQHLVSFDRLAALVFARGEMVNRLEQIDVVERFPFARLQREDQGAFWRVGYGDGESLEKIHRLVAQRCVVDFDAAGLPLPCRADRRLGDSARSGLS